MLAKLRLLCYTKKRKSDCSLTTAPQAANAVVVRPFCPWSGWPAHLVELAFLFLVNFHKKPLIGGRKQE
jgi:hypothetical protein